MPLIQFSNLNHNSTFALWKITESKEELMFLMGSNLTDHGLNLHNSIHWLASRVLLSKVFPNDQITLTKNKDNKPSLSVNGIVYHISISHSYEYATIIVNGDNPVAIDIERIDPRILRVARKFIGEKEQFSLDIKTLTTIWSAKETLYKYYSLKEVDFKQNLLIYPFEQVGTNYQIQGFIQMPSFSKLLTIDVEHLNGYVLTWIA